MKNIKNWSSWVPITKIFCVPHAIDEKSRNTKWKDITMDGRTGGIKGAILIEDNGYLEQSDVGIYWIKIEKPSKKYKTSTWNYIGKSAKFSGREKSQIGIAARVCEHINKMQNWPHRGHIIDALIRKYLKQLGEDCSLDKKISYNEDDYLAEKKYYKFAYNCLLRGIKNWARKIDDNNLIFILGDHGWAFEKNIMKKYNLDPIES